MWPMIWLHGKKIGRNVIGKLVTMRVQCRSLWIDISVGLGLGKVDIFPHANTNQMVASSEEHVNKNVERMSHSVDINLVSLSWTFLSCIFLAPRRLLVIWRKSCPQWTRLKIQIVFTFPASLFHYSQPLSYSLEWILKINQVPTNPCLIFYFLQEN